MERHRWIAGLGILAGAFSALAAPSWDDLTAKGWEALAEARYAEAEEAWREALARAPELPPTDPRRASSHLHLAMVLRAEGHLGEAEAEARRALELVEATGRRGTTDEARVLVTLGSVLRQACRFAEAEERLRSSVAIYDRRDDGHPDMATALTELAVLLRATGKVDAAEDSYERALRIREQAFGRSDPEVARAMNNLALLKRDRGRLDEAEELLRDAIATWERTVGSVHPDVASGYSNLGLVAKSRGDVDAAVRHFRKAIATWEEALGPGHPDVAAGLNNLASAYRMQGRYADAEAAHVRALAIRRSALGAMHPDVARSLTNLAFLYGTQERFGDAERTFAEAMDIWESGVDGCEAARGLDLYASMLRQNGRDGEAVRMETRARELRATGDEGP